MSTKFDSKRQYLVYVDKHRCNSNQQAKNNQARAKQLIKILI